MVQGHPKKAFHKREINARKNEDDLAERCQGQIHGISCAKAPL